MNTQIRRFWFYIALIAAILILALIIPQGSSLSIVNPTFADVGDLIKTVNVPVSAQCSSDFGTSVAIVPGSMIGLHQHPLVLYPKSWTAGYCEI